MLKSRFDHISPADYNSAAVLVREVGAQLVGRLDLVALKPKRILELGCGVGFCTQLLRKRYPEAEIWAVDDSAEILAYARKVSPSQIHWVCTPLDISTIENHSIDLVVANLILPWCDDSKHILQEFLRVLRPEGLLMFSSYGPDTLRELQGQNLLPCFVDMHDLGDLLLELGFADPVLDIDYFTLTYNKQQRLQDELQITGFISEQEKIPPLEKNRAGVIPLTYEVIYGHAWQPEISHKVSAKDGVAKFPLAYLRGVNK